MIQRPIRFLLGPQRPTVNLAAAVAALPADERPIAIISAGWQEAEGDIDHVQEAVGRPLYDLQLYRRASAIFQDDASLREAYRQRQDRLKAQQRLYRMRLKQLTIAARKLLAAEGEADMLAAEQSHAIAQVRTLDRHHLHRTHSIHQLYENELSAKNNAALAAQTTEIESVLNDCSAVLITGGNVVVLLNRMRLFGIGPLLRQKHIIAWSAGAMALAERVVLFHDRTPQRRRTPEILGAGCGLISRFVFLPDAQHRLQQTNRHHIKLFSRRFSPDVCVTLDSGSALQIDGTRIAHVAAVRRLSRTGRLTRLRAS